jgi:hypothetical protein
MAIRVPRSLQLLVGSGETNVAERTGPAVFDVVKGEAGGSADVDGFRPGADQINAFG